MITTPSMGLTRWDQPNDTFSYTELSDNFAKIDTHDHTSSKGIQIPTGGLANLAVTGPKLANSSVDGSKIGAGAVAESHLATALASKIQPLLVTSLPVSPSDGQEIFFQADATNGCIWHLRYRASATTYKWEFVGGSPVSSEIQTLESTAVNAWVDLTTVGPSITVPMAGDYEISFGASISTATGTTLRGAMVGPKIGTASVDFYDRVSTTMPGATGMSENYNITLFRTIRRNVPTASTVIKVQYQANVGTPSFSARTLFVRPVRVG